MMARKCLALALVAACAAVGQDYMNDAVALRAILDTNKITGISIESISTADSGRIIRLDLTNKDVVRSFIQRIPADIGKLTALRFLSLKDNQIASLPEEIGNLTALKEIDCSGNELKRLPSSISRLKALEKANFESNEFDEFPPQLLSLQNLWYLQLRANRISALPDEISGMSGLKELYLGRNRIASLPRSIMRLKFAYFEHLENKLCSLPSDLDAWLKKIDKQYKEYQKCW